VLSIKEERKKIEKGKMPDEEECPSATRNLSEEFERRI
jgi:hypothetical protein